ncbi:MAG: TolC family protein [Candidatus Aminicenantales bacterium]
MGKNPLRLFARLMVIIRDKKLSLLNNLFYRDALVSSSSILSILIFFLPLKATENPLTLEEALHLALKGNPEILEAQQEIEAWRGFGLQVSAYPLPGISFSYEGLNFGHQQGEREVNLGLTQTIEFPGKRSLRQEAVRQGLEAALWRLEWRKMLVVGRVKRAYFSVALSQETLVYYQSLLEFLRDSLRAAQARYEAGEVLYLDVLRLELEELNLHNEMIRAEKELEQSWAELNLLLGGEATKRREVRVDLTYQPLTISLETLLEEVRTRPSLITLQKELAKTEAEVGLARKSLLPDIQLGVFYPSLRTSSWGFGLGLSLPLWKTQMKGATQEAMARQQAAAIALEFHKRRLITGITAAYNRAKSLERRLGLFEHSLLEQSQSMLRLAISLYAQGKAGFLELIDVYRLNRETRLGYLKTFFDYQVSLAEIEVAGEIDPEAWITSRE